MKDLNNILIGIALIIIGLAIAFTGESMGQGTDDYFVGLISYAGGFIIAFIGTGILLKVYQNKKEKST